MSEAKPIDRTAAGLRDSLFGVLEDLRAGRIDASQAKAAATVAQTIVKSVEVQMQFERDKLESKVPSNLSDMKLIPPLHGVRNGQ